MEPGTERVIYCMSMSMISVCIQGLCWMLEIFWLPAITAYVYVVLQVSGMVQVPSSKPDCEGSSSEILSEDYRMLTM